MKKTEQNRRNALFNIVIQFCGGRFSGRWVRGKFCRFWVGPGVAISSSTQTVIGADIAIRGKLTVFEKRQKPL